MVSNAQMQCFWFALTKSMALFTRTDEKGQTGNYIDGVQNRFQNRFHWSLQVS